MDEEKLEIKIEADISEATDGIDKFIQVLQSLEGPLSRIGEVMSKITTPLSNLSATVAKVNSIKFDNFSSQIEALATSLQPLSGFKSQASGVISSMRGLADAVKQVNAIQPESFEAFATQMNRLKSAMLPLNDISGRLGTALRSLGNVQTAITGLESLNKEVSSGTSKFDAFSKDINQLVSALSNLGSIDSKLGSTVTQLNKFTKVANSLDSVDFKKFENTLESLARALKPLESIGKMNLGAIVSQLNKLETSLKRLSNLDLDKLKRTIAGVSSALRSLGAVGGTNLVAVSNQLNAIGKTNLGGLTKSSKQAGSSIGNMASNLAGSGNAAVKVGSSLAKAGTSAGKVGSSLAKAGTSAGKTGSALGKLASVGSKVGTSIGNMASNLAGSGGKFLKFAAVASVVVAALRQIVSVVSEGITNINSYIENMNLFSVAMGSSAESATAFANEVSKSLGLDVSNFVRYQGIFQQIASGFGVAGEKAAVMSTDLTQLGYDMSSFFNIGIEDAMTKLRSGLAGELEPLRNLGYALDEATLSQLAYSMGIEKSIRNMTQAEKSQLRYLAIIQQSKNSIGDLGKTIQTPANQIRILKEQFSQFSRAIGSLFIPLLQAVLPYLIAIVTVLTEMTNKLAAVFGFKMPEIQTSQYQGDLPPLEAEIETDTSAFDDIGDTSGLEDMSTSFTDVGNSAEEATKKVNKFLAPFDEITNINKEVKEPALPKPPKEEKPPKIELPEQDISSLLGERIQGAYGTLNLDLNDQGMSDKIDLVRAKMEEFFGYIKEGFMLFFQPIADAWASHGQPVVDSFWGMIDKIRELVSTVADSFIKMWTGGQGEKIWAAILELITKVQKFIGKLAEDIKAAWDRFGLGDDIAMNLGKSWESFFKALGKGVDMLQAIWDLLGPPLLAIVMPVLNFILGASVPIFDIIGGIFKLVQSLFTTDDSERIRLFGEFIGDTFKGLGDIVGEALKAVGEIVWGFLASIGLVSEEQAAEMVKIWTDGLAWFGELWNNGLKVIGDWWNSFGEQGEKGMNTFREWFFAIPENIKKGFDEAIANIIAWWDNLVNTTGNKIEEIKNWIFSIPKAVEDAFWGVINGIRGWWDNLVRDARAIAEKIKGIFDPVVGFFTGGSKKTTSSSNGNFQRIPQYADGGFVQGQLFVANEPGNPEMVGSIGGRTAVANNDQITSAISSAVYRAVVQAVKDTSQGGSRQSEQQGDINLVVDGQTLGRVAIKEINRASKQTGVSLIPV